MYQAVNMKAASTSILKTPGQGLLTPKSRGSTSKITKKRLTFGHPIATFVDPPDPDPLVSVKEVIEEDLLQNLVSGLLEGGCQAYGVKGFNHLSNSELDLKLCKRKISSALQEKYGWRYKYFANFHTIDKSPLKTSDGEGLYLVIGRKQNARDLWNETMPREKFLCRRLFHCLFTGRNCFDSPRVHSQKRRGLRPLLLVHDPRDNFQFIKPAIMEAFRIMIYPMSEICSLDMKIFGGRSLLTYAAQNMLAFDASVVITAVVKNVVAGKTHENECTWEIPFLYLAEFFSPSTMAEITDSNVWQVWRTLEQHLSNLISVNMSLFTITSIRFSDFHISNTGYIKAGNVRQEFCLLVLEFLTKCTQSFFSMWRMGHQGKH